MNRSTSSAETARSHGGRIGVPIGGIAVDVGFDPLDQREDVDRDQGDHLVQVVENLTTSPSTLV